MGEVVILKEYAKKTAEQRRFEREAYHEIVEKLKPVELRWKGRNLEIRYDGASAPEVYKQIHTNPAWALQVFGTVYEIHQGTAVDTIVLFPDKLYFHKSWFVQRWRKIIVVVWRTEKTADTEILVEASSLKIKEKQISYCFR